MSHPSSADALSPAVIDRNSYILGMITAFAECVANECKKMAFSPPFYPADHNRVLAGAEAIAAGTGIQLWFEKNQDLPAERRLNWFVLYKFPEVLQEYMRLRKRGYNPALHLERFFDLLSYGTVWGEHAEKVVPAIREQPPAGDIFAAVLLKPGAWPLQHE